MLSDWTKDISQSIIKEKKKRKGMVREMKNSIREALVKSLPIFFSYICVAFGYGLLMQKAGFAWYYALFTSFIIYTGAFQFVLITFLKSGASIVTIALTAFLMNSRQSFYSLTFLKDFKAMGKAKWYRIICLLFFGKTNFILLALIIASGILLLWQRKEKNEVHYEKSY